MTVFTNGHHRLLVSRSEPARSLSCSVRTRLLETAAANWHILLAIGTTIATATYLRMRSRARARDSAIAATIVEDVLEALHTEAESHAGDPIRHPVPGLSVVQVRDHFLEVAGRGAGSGNDGGGGGGGFESSQFGSEYVRTQDAQLRTRWRVPDDAARDRIWAVVAARVLRNSSVRETVMELRGEPHQVWQWIGGHALSPRKKR
ncbi:inner nuclear membrane protein MAN1, partial [Zopfochytrium polystomum]